MASTELAAANKGFVLIVRIALVLLLILVGAIVRTFIGPSKERGRVMAVGMLGGMAAGVAVSYLAPSSLKMQESVFFAISGMLLGFGVVWFLPEEFRARQTRYGVRVWIPVAVGEDRRLGVYLTCACRT